MDAEILMRLDAVLWWLEFIAGLQIGFVAGLILHPILIACLKRLWP